MSSLGLGLCLSLAAASERQAVQCSMLALLGVVFFSGFALPLKALQQPALTVSYALPATYGAVLLQDMMLRGVRGSDWFLIVLSLISIMLFGVLDVATLADHRALTDIAMQSRDTEWSERK